MSKSKKLIRNVLIIVILLFGICFFGGFYTSKEQCVLETLRGLHMKDKEQVLDIKIGNMIYTIVPNEENQNMVIVGTQKIGFLYREKSWSEVSGDENNVTVSWSNTVDGKGHIVVAERVDESIAKTEVMMDKDGEVFFLEFDEWTKNISAAYVESERMNFINYISYDEAGNQIENLHNLTF